jgi:SulP family sulfate permease
VELVAHKSNDHPRSRDLPETVLVYDIDGAMFFGSAQKALRALTSVQPNIRVVILEMSDVPMIDMTAMVAMESILDNFRKQKIKLIINNLKPELIQVVEKVGIREEGGVLKFTQSMDEAVDRALIAVAA